MDVRNATKQPMPLIDLPPRSFVTGAIVAVGAAIGLTTTIELGIASSWWDEQRIVLLATVLLVSAFAFVLRATGSRVSIDWPLALAVPVALGSFSALQAARPLVAFLDVALYAVVGCYILLFRGAPRRDLAIAGAAFIVAVASPYVVGVLARYISALLLSMPIGADTLLVGFANPRFPAHLQALTIPLFPLALTLVRSPLPRVALMATGALWWMCVIGSGSRTAWVALAAAAVIAVFIDGHRGQWIRVQLRLGAAGTALYVLGFLAVPHVLGLESTAEAGRLSQFASLGARMELWHASARAIAAEPWLGLGPMHFAFANNGIAAHPHNFWLQIAAEWGVAAGVVVACVSILLWLRSVVAARALQRQCKSGQIGQEDAALAVGVATAVTAWIVAIQADGLMVVPTSQAASAVVLGLACGLVETRKRELSSPTIPHALAVIIFAPAAAILISLPFTSFSEVKAREDAWLKANLGAVMAPRFWQQGWIGPGDDPTARGEVVRR